MRRIHSCFLGMVQLAGTSPLRWLWTGLSCVPLSVACVSPDAAADSGGVVESESYVVEYSTDPSPAEVGENELTLLIEDRAGRPVTDAEVTVEAWMEAHGHGTEKDPSVQYVEKGRYHVEGLVFQMPGEWRLDVQITVGDESEGVSFEIGVE